MLDCFSGSGTFAKVASLFGREAIGIEINPEYHRIAAVRMEETQKHVNPKIITMIEKKIAA